MKPEETLNRVVNSLISGGSNRLHIEINPRNFCDEVSIKAIRKTDIFECQWYNGVSLREIVEMSLKFSKHRMALVGIDDDGLFLLLYKNP